MVNISNKRRVKMVGNLRTNKHVQTAVVEVFALNRTHPGAEDANDEYGEAAGGCVSRCYSRLGLDSSDGKLTRKQMARQDAVMEAILTGADRMEAALVKARLLQSN
jgi:hypothetical protein